MIHPTPEISRLDDLFVGRFRAMGGPCELLCDVDHSSEAKDLAALAQFEAERIERAFSRYLAGNVIARINQAGGAPVTVDDETAMLLDYASACHRLSSGRFDITSGVLRRAWTFDGGEQVPTDEQLRPLLDLVGWERVDWQPPVVRLPAGMEIDLGGIGKEYAVDRAAALLAARTSNPFLVNFGGDLFASGPRRSGQPWIVGVDDPERSGLGAVGLLHLERGGLATSGDARRFVLHAGRRLGHILDPRTGWPVEGAPRAITVAAATCLEAGTLATLAYLRGAEAEAFLIEEGATYWLA